MNVRYLNNQSITWSMMSLNVLFYPQPQDMMYVYKKPENIHI